MQTIKIQSKIKDYEISFFDKDMVLRFIQEQRDTASCFVIDSNVWNIYSSNILEVIDSSRVINILSNEENKSFRTVLTIYDTFIKYSLKRNSVVITIGGGVVQDLAGFACSTFYRGVDWVFIPTTVLSQADSCMGGKTSLNFGGYKNIIGSFYPPSQVIICVEFLNTLDDIYYYSGLGEVAKLHIMGGEKSLNEFIETVGLVKSRNLASLSKVIESSLLVKESFIAEDEFDKSRRHLLNYGHCFGHAIESSTKFMVPHGQAVLLGMFLANSVSVKRGLLSPRSHEEIAENILAPLIIVKLDVRQLSQASMIDAMKKDKKRIDNRLVVILLSESLELKEYNDLLVDEIRDALFDLYEWIAKRLMDN